MHYSTIVIVEFWSTSGLRTESTDSIVFNMLYEYYGSLSMGRDRKALNDLVVLRSE